MSSDQRLPIFPTRMNLGLVKTRLQGAITGHTLLKRKSDALQMKYKETQLLLELKKKNITELMNKAFFSLSIAEHHDANLDLYANECKKNVTRLNVEREMVSGVVLTKFDLIFDKKPIKFLDTSGTDLARCRDNFIHVLKSLVDLVGLQYNFTVLNSVLKAVNRRINALEFLMIPKLENTANYINSELDEQDREEFYRLKKIQSMKKQANPLKD